VIADAPEPDCSTWNIEGATFGVDMISRVGNPVIVLDYDSSWVESFWALRGQIADALGDLAAAIEHVGSTAVPGLAAKPIIDIDVLLASELALPMAIERLVSRGYVYQGNLGIPEREAFAALVNDPPHHLYVCPPHSAELRRHIAFRDYLRAHAVEARAYGDLKHALAQRFRDDRSAYMAGKDALVRELLRRAMAWSTA
jgi:GrpB-like predicted nucleotidyltransferase (UPF0157 family)